MIATAGCPALGLFGLLDSDVGMSFYLLLGLPPVVMKGYDFSKVGGKDGHAGVLNKFSRVAGGSFDLSCATVPLAPTTSPKKKKKRWAAWHGLRAPCQHFRI